MISFQYSTGQSVELSTVAIIIIAIFALALVIGFYLLRSFGVYKLAKNNGIDKAYLAFIPGVWIYTACLLVKEARFFRTSMGKVALIFTIIFSIGVIGNFIIDVIIYTPLVTYYLGGMDKGAKIIISSLESISGYSQYIDGVFVLSENFKFPFSDGFLSFLYVLQYITSITFYLGEVIAIFVYFALFRKFWPEYHVLVAILSAFGLFPPFVFAIRNKTAINYNDYVRARMGQYNNYGNNNYNGSNYGGGYSSPKDPFDDLGADESSSRKIDDDDPFDDFD